MQSKTSKPILSFIVVLAVVCAIAFTICTYQLSVSEFAVVSHFGTPSVVNEPGLNFRVPWPIQKVIKFDRRKKLYEGIPREIPTKDNINLIVNTFAIWRINDPLLYFNIRTRIRSDAKLWLRNPKFKVDPEISVRSEHKITSITKHEMKFVFSLQVT